ncbi:MAG: DNA-processing protein DprA [Candidatus Pacebacteria bacterium]|nr:DNA-processing protein DprA [Candidatus Paceibacterota bacterium]
MDIQNRHTIFELAKDRWPILLNEMNDPPKQLYCIGKPPPIDAVYLTVIGSRAPTDYGRDCVHSLIMGLTGYPIVIVSGLALGIDGLAHEAALEAGLLTVSFPGSGLNWNAIYPSQHRALADRIISYGGCLLSEFKHEQTGTRWSFPQRNRLMAGISKATLIIEGRLESGSLITTKQAFDYNRSVLALPGSITNPLSAGPNMLLRTPSAIAVTCSNDILEELGFERRGSFPAISPDRLAALDPLSRSIIDMLERGSMNKDNLCRELGIPMIDLNPLVSFLEIDGFVKTTGNVVRRVA